MLECEICHCLCVKSSLKSVVVFVSVTDRLAGSLPDRWSSSLLWSVVFRKVTFLSRPSRVRPFSRLAAVCGVLAKTVVSCS